jgi:hypothetical protein
MAKGVNTAAKEGLLVANRQGHEGKASCLQSGQPLLVMLLLIPSQASATQTSS